MIGFWLDHPTLVMVTVALSAVGVLLLAFLWPHDGRRDDLYPTLRPPVHDPEIVTQPRPPFYDQDKESSR
jgi:hypothetical protein